MRIGVIADIHANLLALEAVLEDMPSIDLLLCAGDVVGYYAEPNQVCQILRNSNARVVRGNHDAYVIGALAPSPRNMKAYRIEWTRAQLIEDNFEWLRSLPTTEVIEIGGHTLTLRHANPWDEETYLYPDSRQVAEFHLGSREMLIVGHTHHPMCKPAGEGLIVNPGSVGQPRDWSPLAAYATILLPEGEVKLHRAMYDVDRVQERLQELGWDKAMISILNRSRV